MTIAVTYNQLLGEINLFSFLSGCPTFLCEVMRVCAQAVGDTWLMCVSLFFFFFSVLQLKTGSTVISQSSGTC